MGLRDRVTSFAESRLGLAITPVPTMQRLTEIASNFETFRLEASELAYHALNYVGGSPQDLLPERRARLAQRSRIAFIQDPLAGAEAQHLANFAFGRGVARPDAEEDRVQQVIDRAWSDPNNEEKMTGFAAQRRSSHSLLTQGELFDTLYVSGGRVRVGKLNPDEVFDIVTDPDDGGRPIYYVSHRKTTKWNVETHSYEATWETTEEGRPKITYYPHWRNLKDAEREREADAEGLLKPLPTIPEKLLAPGGAVVYHTAVNQLDGQLRGTPPWARSLRFYSAMNQFTEARVTMAQAAATFIAKQTMEGGSPDSIVKEASSILAQTGEIAASSFEARYGHDPDPSRRIGAQPGELPPNPGSWFVANEGMNLESLSLNSGAQAAQADGQIIRAPLAAASGFGQHYLGDASNANLATATSLELPSLMHVQAWQQYAEQRLSWFTDRSIEEAAKAGELGQELNADEDEEDSRPLGELYLQEDDSRATFERRTGKTLTYTFEMPYPGRRNLPDVTSTFTQTLSVDQGILAQSDTLMETLLTFLLKDGLQMDDAASKAQKIVKEVAKAREERQAQAEKQRQEQLAAAAAKGQGSSAQDPTTPAPDIRPGDQPAGATEPGDEMAEREWLPEDLRSTAREYGADTATLFDRIVRDPAVLTVKQLAAAGSNGNGAGG